MADARSLGLVLLGGRTGAEVEGHDWEFILTELGVLHRRPQLGMTAYWLGMILMVGSLGYAARTILAEHRAQAGPRSE